MEVVLSSILHKYEDRQDVEDFSKENYFENSKFSSLLEGSVKLTFEKNLRQQVRIGSLLQ